MQTLIIESLVKFEVSSKLYEQIRCLPYKYDYARCLEEKDGELIVRNADLTDAQRTLEAIIALLLHDLVNGILRTNSHGKIWNDERIRKVANARFLIDQIKREGNSDEAYWKTLELLGEVFSYRFEIEQDTTKPYTIKRKSDKI